MLRVVVVFVMALLVVAAIDAARANPDVRNLAAEPTGTSPVRSIETEQMVALVLLVRADDYQSCRRGFRRSQDSRSIWL